MEHLNEKECKSAGMAVRDTLEIISGKWKLILLLTFYKKGKRRFRELVKELNISPRVLSKELQELEMNKLVTRTVRNTRPMTVEYDITPYCRTLGSVLQPMKEWGELHRQEIIGKKNSE
ncbi:winged helix-turn-helix transcriptional regulator [Chitinophaga arvensicola]|uniref:DNA-binding transcriptional regulator, HxlR family n=1 Tax=Chitinophaga arvensicola TaxID=29529 RepID=A0A1I0SBC3_9BACT|nr:helix-turn-helix domain-containing protein [Chitinophaga arvensicola]SEW53998.1 DNA-binding transcriptional regulator, HxlR family [Chitinophaga arvensicola]